MSSESSAIDGPIEDRFAPFNERENEICDEIARCSDAGRKEPLTFRLAAFYLETARPEKSVPHLRWIVETTRSDESRQDALRTLEYLSGSGERGIAGSEGGLDLPRVLWEMANTFLGKMNQQTGILCLLRLLDLSSDQERRAECFLLLGVECEKVDEYEGAVRLYRRGIECDPKGIETRYFLHNNRGYCLNRLGQHEEAEELCRAAIEIDPRRHNAYKNLGVALQGQGMYPEAAACFVRAAIMGPPDPRSVGHLEELLVHHREDVEREIPDIAEHLAAAVEVRKRLMQ